MLVIAQKLAERGPAAGAAAVRLRAERVAEAGARRGGRRLGDALGRGAGRRWRRSACSTLRARLRERLRGWQSSGLALPPPDYRRVVVADLLRARRAAMSGAATPCARDPRAARSARACACTGGVERFVCQLGNELVGARPDGDDRQRRHAARAAVVYPLDPRVRVAAGAATLPARSGPRLGRALALLRARWRVGRALGRVVDATQADVVVLNGARHRLLGAGAASRGWRRAASAATTTISTRARRSGAGCARASIRASPPSSA